MHFLFTLILIAIIAAAYLFYDKFTRHGAVPLSTAWRSYTSWLAGVGLVLGQYLVDLFAWAATQVDFLQDQFGSLLSNPASGDALKLISGIFLLLRLKGQGLPGLNLPSFPDDTDQAGA